MALAGCLASPAPEPLDPASALEAAPRLGAESLLPQARSHASLDAPPAWAVGEWWRVRWENVAFRHSAEIVRVVAGDEPGHYLVGMPSESSSDEAMVMHFPGFGQVAKANLAFEAYDLLVEPLQFPLRERSTWTTQWSNRDPMEARVARVTETNAEALIEHPLRRTTLTYDAAIGEIRSIALEGYVRYEVVEHGFGYGGRVVVPYAHDLVVCHGRVNAAQAIDDCGRDAAPRGPVETIRVMDPPEPGGRRAAGSGFFGVEVEAPDGSVYRAAKSPAEAGPVLLPFGHAEPNGDWTMTAFAAGAGTVLFEGPAYRVLEVKLGG